MPKEEWGTKRLCPTTGQRFYDLNRTPIISPYTGEVVDIDIMAARNRTLASEKTAVADDEDDLVDDEDLSDDSGDLDDDLLDEDDDGDVSLDDIADVPESDED